MAQKEMVIGISGDATKLTKATGTAEKDLAKLNTAADKSAKHLNDLGNKTHAGLGKMQSSISGVAGTFASSTTNMGGAVQGFTGQIAGAVSNLGPWGMAIGATVGIAGGATAALFSFAGSAADLGVSIGKLQRLTGGTAEEMSVFAFMAQQTGTDVNALGKSIAIFDKKLVAGGLEKYGIAARDMNGELRPTTDILGDLADQFEVMDDGPEKTAMALDLFGKSGAAMIPMLNGGREALVDYASEAEEFGLVMGDEQVANAKKMKGAQRDLSAAFQGLQVQIGQHVMPAVTALTNWLSDHMKPIIQAITPAIEWLKTAFSELGAAFEANGWEGALEKAGEKFGELWDMISPYLETLMQKIGQWVETTAAPWLQQKFGEWAWAGLQWMVQLNWQIIGKAGELLVSLGSWIVNTGVPWLVQKFGEWYPAAMQWVTAMILDIPGKLAEFAGTIVGWVARFVVEIPGHVAGIRDAFFSWIRDAIAQSPGKLAEFAGTLWDFFINLPGQIMEWTANAATWLVDIGGNIIEGLKDGLWQAIENLGGWLLGLKDRFTEKFKEAFGIASPAKVMLPLGGFLAAGVGEGLTAGLDKIGRQELPEIAARFSTTSVASKAPSTDATRIAAASGGQVGPFVGDVYFEGEKVGRAVLRQMNSLEGSMA